MPALKVYTPGNLGSIDAEVRDALDEAKHIRQARILIVAGSKAAAYQLANSLPQIGVPPASNPEWSAATGNDVDALDDAGLLGDQRVFALSMSWTFGPVVEVDADGARVVGRLANDGLLSRFIPEEAR